MSVPGREAVQAVYRALARDSLVPTDGRVLAAAALLEWLSAHTHRRSLRYRTAGFTYDEQLDHWSCPEGQHLWPHEFDHERRLVRYRAKA